MALIDSYDVFSTLEQNFLQNLLKTLIISHNPQKAPVTFTDAYIKEHGHKVLNYLNLLKETLQKHKQKRGTYSNKYPRN